MILMPDDATAVVDPFTEEVTVNLRCNIVEPSTMQGYERDPRSVALRAEEYLKSTGIGDTSFFGPEPEFFVFDNVQWKADMSGAMYKIDAEEAAWASSAEFEGGNMAHRPGVKGGYFPVPPIDSAMDLRTAMCETMGAMGLQVEVHHHEVATACQNEIGVKFNTLVNKADEVQYLSTLCITLLMPTAKPQHLCPSHWSAIMDRVCTAISPSGKTAKTYLQAMVMPACLMRLFIILAASSSTHEPLMLLQTHRQTHTNAWSLALKRP